MKFSIIIAYYQGTDSDEELDRCMNSIKEQTYKDYEILLIHDGELLRECKYDVICTEKRENIWGHNSRKLGIDRATGDYILITNADNVYTNDALEVLNNAMQKDVEIYIMACCMMGLHWDVDKNMVWYDEPRDNSVKTVLKGNPKYGSIDAMQLCASKKVWEEVGGWYSYAKGSDGIIYEKMCKTRPYKILKALIGYHY